MVALTEEAAKSSATVIAPSTARKYPRTLVTIAWRATKPTSVWAGSMAYVPGLMAMLMTGTPCGRG